MGKLERDWAEEVEKNTAAGIRGEAVNAADQKIADAVRAHVEAEFKQSIKTAKWVGATSYGDAGDVHVFLSDDTKIPVELKTSKADSSGTKANPGNNFIKKYVKDAVNYSDFDDNLGLRKQRYDLVESVVGHKLEKKAHYEKALRGLRDAGHSELVKQIKAITRPGQIQYASYVTELLSNHLRETQQMVDDILAGNNTTKVTQTENLVYCVVKQYQTKAQTVEFYDFSQMDSTVARVVCDDDQSSFKIQNAAGHDIITLSVLWKNICQGGAGPAHNIFIGNAFKP